MSHDHWHGGHCAARRGDELRGQAEICRQLAASSLMERHKLVWLRLANEWLELARRADELVIWVCADRR